jgi:hypothetical protein
LRKIRGRRGRMQNSGNCHGRVGGTKERVKVTSLRM